MSVLFDSGTEVNAIYLNFVRELELSIKPMDVGVQKIEGTILDTFKMVVTNFSVTGKTNRVRFFEKTFLVANICLEVALGMPFLTLSSADIDFLDRELR